MHLKKNTKPNKFKYHNNIRTIPEVGGTANNSQPLFFYHCSAEGWGDFKTAIINNKLASKWASLLHFSLLSPPPPKQRGGSNKAATSLIKQKRGVFFPINIHAIRYTKKRKNSRAYWFWAFLKLKLMMTFSLCQVGQVRKQEQLSLSTTILAIVTFLCIFLLLLAIF